MINNALFIVLIIGLFVELILLFDEVSILREETEKLQQ